MRKPNFENSRFGFTIIELVVSVALLAMVVSFTTIIFRYNIEAYRKAKANTEIMQSYRAITDQLNSDFKGLRKDAPMLIFFRQRSGTDERYDQIMFFANGDFESIQPYDDYDTPGVLVPSLTGTPIVGNAARIYYGQATVGGTKPWNMHTQDKPKYILGRRQHILSSDPELSLWPDPLSIVLSFDDFGGKLYSKNELFEHDSLGLSGWKKLDRNYYNTAEVINTIFDEPVLIDTNDPATYHKMLGQGVGNLTIQWGYRDLLLEDFGIWRIYWFPSDDPDGDGSTLDSHFNLMRDETEPGVLGDNGILRYFGCYFNIPNCGAFRNWWPGPDALIRSTFPFSSLPKFLNKVYFPDALKFTFTVYDSKGVVAGGREFSHIVYISR